MLGCFLNSNSSAKPIARDLYKYYGRTGAVWGGLVLYIYSFSNFFPYLVSKLTCGTNWGQLAHVIMSQKKPSKGLLDPSLGSLNSQ